MEDKLYRKIDNDLGLKAKRRVLTITSLILLTIQFSGAKIIEANTFILKLEFKHQNGISLLLMISILFFLLRYYNYAKPYHNMLSAIWKKHFMQNSYITYYHPHEPGVYGLSNEIHPEGFNIDSFIHGDDNHTYSCSYECKNILSRSFSFNWDGEYERHFGKVNIFKELGWAKYLKVLKLEFKYQFSRYFTHRENLDILAPYFLGLISVFSYIFNDYFQSILNNMA